MYNMYKKKVGKKCFYKLNSGNKLNENFVTVDQNTSRTFQGIAQLARIY